MDEAAKEDLAKGPTHGGHHIAKLLKFLTVRTERGREKLALGLVGGRWSAKLDGGNPRYPRNQPSALVPRHPVAKSLCAEALHT